MNGVVKFAATAAVVWACALGAQAEVVIDTVTVGNPGNTGELSGASAPGGWGPDRICGAVDYVYNIGKFEVTAAQYTEFLNAVATTDTYSLYHSLMWQGAQGCKIQRSGSSGSYSYSVTSSFANRAVNFVSWGDAVRFANWMHNEQPTGAQDLSTTEDGSYYVNGAMSNAALIAVTRKPGATWVIPSEDEWYKAAYHLNDGVTGNYFDYPTQSNTAPTAEAPPGTDLVNGSANYYDGISYRLTDVGAYDAKPSDSAYGTFDQGGGIGELNEEVQSGLYRCTRGSTWYQSAVIVLHAGYRSHVVNQTTEQAEFGFRVAEIPPPIPTVSEWGLAVMVLLVLVGGSLLLRRRTTLAA